MLTMWYDHILYVSNILLAISTELLFWALQLWSFSFSRKHSHHDNNDEWIILADMQHSQTHMTFYREVIFLSWGGRIFCKVESLMMILFLKSFPFFSSPSSGVITMILCGSLPDTCNKVFVMNCFGFTIKGDVKTIICYCKLYNLRMFYNPIVKGFFELLIYFFMITDIKNVWSQQIPWSDCLEF